ncbi:Phosphoglycerate kinase [hydrothermal vent metagenome]|uniref:phosphoglycerate kinase n=1 Tax=hydrothermal vent metagenome TaxID=652676 RepID=A0A3B1C8A8_9ZZZZ
MNKLSIDQIDLKGKRVFIRVDFNVPLENGEVSDDTRIRKAIPTIKYAVDQGARVIVASHLGRPRGEPKPEYSLKPVASVFSDLLGAPVLFVEECVGDIVKSAVETLNDGGVLLLENLRFHKQEKENDDDFARGLASLADIYVNDAFGTAHRAHASTEGITRFVDTCAAGFLMKSEIDYFNKSMTHPKRPLAAIIGGAKVSTKLQALDHLVDKCDIMLIGGGMTFTFLKYMGLEIGDNILEEEMIEEAGKIMAKAKSKGVRFYLPVDFVIADTIDDNAPVDHVTFQELPKRKIALDIGPATIELFKLAIKNAKTIIWNGPMGVFEKKPFAGGTMAMVEALAQSDALTVVGGGDSVKAVNMAKAADRIDFISTGGGAFLELIEGKTLPGLAALDDVG